MNLFDFFSFSSPAHNKKLQADAALCGRSMVEMLGVLAIIGVLSVGAISGYSKAMLKYKLNKQAEAMTILLNNAMQLRPNLPETGNEHYAQLLSKLNLLPDGIKILPTNNQYMEDMFGNIVLFYATNTYYGIGYNFIDSGGRGDRANRFEICRNIINIFKINSSILKEFITDRKYTSDDSDEIQSGNSGFYVGDALCDRGLYKCMKDITLNDIDNLCNQCRDNSTECRFSVRWI